MGNKELNKQICIFFFCCVCVCELESFGATNVGSCEYLTTLRQITKGTLKAMPLIYSHRIYKRDIGDKTTSLDRASFQLQNTKFSI